MAIEERVCLGCSNSFNIKASIKQKYCSQDCYNTIKASERQNDRMKNPMNRFFLNSQKERFSKPIDRQG